MSNLYHKVMVIGTMNLVSISCGFTYGHLTGLIRSLQKKEDGIDLSEGQISLLAACLTFSGMIGIVLLGLFGDRAGRRWTTALFSIPLLVNWVLAHFATSYPTLLLSRILAGIAIGGLSVINTVTAAEYTSPKSRAIIQSLVSMVSPALGTGLGHILGIIMHWRTLNFFGFVLTVIHLCLPYFWVESPQWLASKGRFEDCEVAFRKLHGIKPKSEDELRLLVNVESGKKKQAIEMRRNNLTKKVLAAFKKKYFWNIMLMNFMVYLYYAAAAKTVFSSLATVMLEDITGTSDVLLFTLLVDGFILIGTCVSCFLIRKLTIRVLFFSSGFVANCILITLSACLYFKNSEPYFRWINVCLLAFYFIIVHAGPYPVMEILLGEMFPLDIKLVCFLLGTPGALATVCASIMLMPILVGLIGYHGVFLLNSGVVFICLAYFWVRLPDTKGKTLQEIELNFANNAFNVDSNGLSNEQIKAFL